MVLSESYQLVLYHSFHDKTKAVEEVIFSYKVYNAQYIFTIEVKNGGGRNLYFKLYYDKFEFVSISIIKLWSLILMYNYKKKKSGGRLEYFKVLNKGSIIKLWSSI